jgi:hypothetical protein
MYKIAAAWNLILTLRGTVVVSWPIDEIICFNDYLQSLQTNAQMKEVL